MKIKFKVNFNRKKTLRADGTAPIVIEAYLNAKRKYFNTGLSIEPKFWDEKRNRVNGKFTSAFEYNSIINDMLLKFEEFEYQMLSKNKTISLSDLDNIDNADSQTDFFDFAKVELEKKNIKKASYTCDRTMLKHLENFNKAFRLKDIDYKFVTDFDKFLRDKGLHVNTVHKLHKGFKSYLNIAMKNGLMPEGKNPYLNFSAPKKDTEREVLTADEVEKIEKIEFNSVTEQLRTLTDMFLFAIYTGLRFSDIQTISVNNIIKSGTEVNLKFQQQKTERYTTIPLHLLFNGKPATLIEKYLTEENGILFKKITNQAANRLLKVIALSSGINKNLTFHIARHTFGTLLAAHTGDQFLIQNLMGHANIKTSLIYIHLSKKHINDKLKNINWE